MLVCLFIALLATFLWINITIAETVNTKNMAVNDNSVKLSKVKTYLVIIMALFWAIVFRY